MNKLKKLILASTILLELIVILIVYLIFFRNSEYKDIVKKYDLIDKFGDYEIYGKKSDSDDYISNAYLIHDKKVISSGETAWYYEGLDGIEDECPNSNCRYNIIEFTNHKKDDVERNSYFINKEKNLVSKSYETIGEGTSNSHYAYYDDRIYVFKNSKYGLLNMDTCKEAMETKYDKIDSVYNDMIVATINNKVGLYNKDGKEILNPEYDYIGVVYDSDKEEYTYISIKGDEIKTFDKDLNDKKIAVKDGLSLYGLYFDDVIDHDSFSLFSNIYASVHNLDVNKNEYFIYKGKEITGKQNILILKFKCEEYTDDMVVNNESIIYIVKDGKLVKLDSSQIELASDSVCYGK